MSHNIILNNQEINHKIKRIAFQILETFIDEECVVIAGIANNGYVLAEKIAATLSTISSLEIILCEVKIDKTNPTSEVKTSISKVTYQNKGVIIVDDVLNSGTTLMYAVKHFLDTPLKKLKTTVLIDRNHKKFPVKVDFKGISLSTSLQEHVTVEFENELSFAYLN
jgi:pyrimidine operon attenuation protein/uracil phosphoribosyltransferase